VGYTFLGVFFRGVLVLLFVFRGVLERVGVDLVSVLFSRLTLAAGVRLAGLVGVFCSVVVVLSSSTNSFFIFLFVFACSTESFAAADDDDDDDDDDEGEIGKEGLRN